jgi:hypothetical protein
MFRAIQGVGAVTFDQIYLGFTAIALLIGQAIAGSLGLTIAGMALTTQTLTLLGSVVLAGVLIGVSLALKPSLPKPNDGAQSTQQNIPPCQYGYGRARIAGPYMFYGTKNGASFDVVALVLGKVAGFVKFFLHDDEVVLNPVNGVVASTPEFSDGRYGDGKVQILTRRGLSTETAYVEMTDLFGAAWTENHRGDGTASLMLRCSATKDKDFQKYYPNQLPNPSAVIDFPAVWDPRDPNQSYSNRDTWDNYPEWSAGTYAKGARVLYGGALYISRDNNNTATPDAWAYWIKAWANPVLQIIDFVTDPVHGMGEPHSRVLPVISDLMAEADLCDQLVNTKSGVEPRYTSNGWFSFETDPAEVYGALLAACDGWTSPNGDGALALKVGVYRAPTAPTLTARHIVAISPDFGVADEEACNELTIKFTSPDHKYREESGQAWRDEDDISERGKTRSQNLQLTWVQSHSQARRLAKRTMARLNARARGSMTTTLYGLAVLGERWVRLQYPDIDGLADVVVEITNASVDFASGRVSFNWLLVNPNEIDAWDPATEEGSPPPSPDDGDEDTLPVPDNVVATTSGNTATGVRVDITFDDPLRDDLTYVVRYRLTAGPGAWVEQAVTDATADGTSVHISTTTLQAGQGYDIQVASAGTRGTRSDWSDTVTANTTGPSPSSPTDIVGTKDGVMAVITWTNPNDPLHSAARVWCGLSTFGAANDLTGAMYSAPSQAMTFSIQPGVGAWKFWVTSESADGARSTPAGPVTVTF